MTRTVLATVVAAETLRECASSSNAAVASAAIQARLLGLSTAFVERPDGTVLSLPCDRVQTCENGILQVLAPDETILAAFGVGGWISARLERPMTSPIWGRI